MAEVAISAPANRSCTYSRSRLLSASLLTFGRRAFRSAFHLAIEAQIVEPAAAGCGVSTQIWRRHPNHRPPRPARRLGTGCPTRRLRRAGHAGGAQHQVTMLCAFANGGSRPG